MTLIESLEWTNAARHILNDMKNLDMDKPALIVLRHSQRYEPKDWEDILHANLTPEGLQVAREFGEHLPNHHQYRIYHSRIYRCQQTAEQIHLGLQNSAKQSQIGGSMNSLTEFYISPEIFKKLTDRDNIKFLRNWLAGHYSSQFVEPAINYAQRALHEIYQIYKNTERNGVDLFITHDFNLLVFRALWAGIFPDGQWADYLGGFILQFGPEQMMIEYNGTKESVFYPHWWHAIVNVPF